MGLISICASCFILLALFVRFFPEKRNLLNLLVLTILGLGFLEYAPPANAAPSADICSSSASSPVPAATNSSAIANDDSDNAVYVAAMTIPIDILSNDIHSLPIDDSAIDLDPAQSGIQQTITNGDGTWSVQSDGTLNFMPNNQGTAQITYTFNISSGQTSNAAKVTILTHSTITTAVDDDLMPYSPDNGVTVIGSVGITANDSALSGQNLDLNSVDIEPQVAGIQHGYTVNNTTISYDPSTGVLSYYASSIPGEYPTITYTIADDTGSRSNIATISYVYGISDVRLKRDITFIERTSNGINLYSFRYLNSDQVYVGVLAQQVMLTHPEAVMLMPNGYYQVNYAKLGLHFETLQHWEAEH